jgi:hypothetical protein
VPLTLRGHGIERSRDGSFRVHLQREERELLAALPGQLDDALDTAEPSLERLFPPGYDDRDDELEYQRLTRDSLLEGKRAALRALADTADFDRLDESQLNTWLAALESLRLVLGTQLDVTEESYVGFDPDDPDAPRIALYHWLSWLQEEVVQALSAGRPRA